MLLETLTMRYKMGEAQGWHLMLVMAMVSRFHLEAHQKASLMRCKISNYETTVCVQWTFCFVLFFFLFAHTRDSGCAIIDSGIMKEADAEEIVVSSSWLIVKLLWYKWIVIIYRTRETQFWKVNTSKERIGSWGFSLFLSISCRRRFVHGSNKSRHFH